jgi:hypothetical protein
MLRRLALIRTDDSEEIMASTIEVKSFGELGTILTVSSNKIKLHNIGFT